MLWTAQTILMTLNLALHQKLRYVGTVFQLFTIEIHYYQISTMKTNWNFFLILCCLLASLNMIVSPESKLKATSLKHVFPSAARSYKMINFGKSWYNLEQALLKFNCPFLFHCTLGGCKFAHKNQDSRYFRCFYLFCLKVTTSSGVKRKANKLKISRKYSNVSTLVLLW